MEDRTMIKFRSNASGEVQMLEAHGEHLLSIIGKAHSSQGVITPAEMSDAIARLQSASRADDASRAATEIKAADADQVEDTDAEPEPIRLSQRSFPLIEMLKRSQTAGEPILWGL